MFLQSNRDFIMSVLEDLNSRHGFKAEDFDLKTFALAKAWEEYWEEAVTQNDDDPMYLWGGERNNIFTRHSRQWLEAAEKATFARYHAGEGI